MWRRYLSKYSIHMYTGCKVYIFNEMKNEKGLGWFSSKKARPFFSFGERKTKYKRKRMIECVVIYIIFHQIIHISSRFRHFLFRKQIFWIRNKKKNLNQKLNSTIFWCRYTQESGKLFTRVNDVTDNKTMPSTAARSPRVLRKEKKN